MLGYAVVCMDARRAADAIKSRWVKSDKVDAYALAEMLRNRAIRFNRQGPRFWCDNANYFGSIRRSRAVAESWRVVSGNGNWLSSPTCSSALPPTDWS